MPYEREKRRVKDGTYYYVVKPRQRGGRFYGFLFKYFGTIPSEDYQRHTAIKQLQEMVRLILKPVVSRRRKPPKSPTP